ncbi:Na/Pi cotransporter family protein [Azospirillum rugosum]|uniref:Phosphate:Na+ symporter n=1 Tax=Azospirillum rugosum TaxID=416170 RepID=A0ABS4SJU1_9PROT|nr:Na/Pi cotransporter family protein [Azospirillum rugosum]MBP2291655.1 phosphate:Na+ symporter [Azospirillum rugosum]MDQ0524533.1 phosphate:Na+ symporter [Azospirillum rugosum]
MLWGLRLVRTGVFRCGGAALRRWVAQGTRNRVVAFLAGTGATLALQSSTATALMAAALAGQGLLGTAMAQAVMLGANVGTSLVTRLLAVDLHWLSPSLLVLGGVLHALGEARRLRRDLASVFLGLGLMLLALRLLGTATIPVERSELVQAMLAALGGEPFFAMLVAAALTAAVHASLAVVLLTASLAGAHIVDPVLAAALVLGANLGGALPVVLETARENAAARRVQIGNLIVRTLGALAVLPFLGTAVTALEGMAPFTAVVTMHVAFNVALVVVFLPLVGPLARLTERLIPDALSEDDDARPRHLDESVLETPSVAIAGALRETLRLGDLVEDMLRRSLVALRQNDERPIAEVSRADDRVDRLHTAIKLYLAKLGRGNLDEAESRRVNEMMAFAINLEHVGDIIDKSLMELAAKRLRHGLHFAAEDFREVEELHRRTVENLRTALGTFIAEDRRLARQLIAGKDAVRALEREATLHHLDRVRRGVADSVETSALVLDVLRDLKRINAHVAAVAHPILDEVGELRESRLKVVGLPRLERRDV